MTFLEQELDLELPERAREIGIKRITIARDTNEITIHYLDTFILSPILGSLTKTYDILEKRCELFRLSTEVIYWIVVIVQLELEKEISN